MTKPPFFILGCVRSGTTMLRDVLRTHPNLCSPEETHVYRWGEPFRTPGFTNKQTKNKTLKAHRGIDGIREGEAQSLYNSSSSRAEYLTAYMEKFVKKNGFEGRRWFDKTPQNIYGLALIRTDFPHSKFVHIVRNPLNVVASLKSGRQMEVPDLVGACNYWTEAVAIISAFAPILGNDLHEVRYEDFTADPKAHADRLLEFLGEDAATGRLALGKIRSERNAYLDDLSEAEQATVRRVCAAGMERYGYADPSSAPASEGGSLSLSAQKRPSVHEGLPQPPVQQ